MRKLPKTYRTNLQSLQILAFSDCRIQDIANFVQRVSSRPPFDLIVYAGDDIERFRPSRSTNYFEQLALTARFGLAAVIGNDDSPLARRLIRGRKVHELNSRPLAIGQFLFVGNEGTSVQSDVSHKTRVELGVTAYSERQMAEHLRMMIPPKGEKTIIIVSHAPPHGCLDDAMRFSMNDANHQIGSTTLRQLVDTDSRVALVICGHAHLSGGRAETLAKAVVINIASHDNRGEPLRSASIELSSSGVKRYDFAEMWPDIQIAGVCGIGYTYSNRLAQAGIRSVDDLAGATPETVGEAIGWTPSKTEIFIARARACVNRKPVLVKPTRLPDSPRLYLDIETDLQKTYCWLVGIGSDSSNNVEQFLAPNPTDERRMLTSLLEYLGSVPDSLIVHFSGTAFDKRVLRKRLVFHKLPIPNALENSVDIHRELFYSVALPIASFGLKQVAATLGYQFAFPELDGFQVAYLYQRTLREGGSIPDKLLQYNKDDVLALRHVVQNATQWAIPAA